MNNRRNGLSLRLSAAITAALLSAPLAHAQNAPPDQQKATAPAKDDATVTTLGTVVVTANRRDETLQKVPMAVSALT